MLQYGIGITDNSEHPNCIITFNEKFLSSPIVVVTANYFNSESKMMAQVGGITNNSVYVWIFKNDSILSEPGVGFEWIAIGKWK